jgi:hypothetical protein
MNEWDFLRVPRVRQSAIFANRVQWLFKPLVLLLCAPLVPCIVITVINHRMNLSMQHCYQCPGIGALLRMRLLAS